MGGRLIAQRISVRTGSNGYLQLSLVSSFLSNILNIVSNIFVMMSKCISLVALHFCSLLSAVSWLKIIRV